MSDRHGVPVLALALLLTATPGRAQEASRQAAILDSISVVRQAAAARRQAWDDSVTRARVTMDTATVGAFRLVVQPGNRDLAVAGARMAMDSLRELGDTVLALVSGHRMVVRRTPIPRWATRRIEPVVVAMLDSAGVEQRPMWDNTATSRIVGNYLIEQARGIIASRIDAPFARWLGGRTGSAPIRFDSARADDWSRLRLDLVSAPSVVARRCYDGSIADCRKVLGLDSSASRVRDDFDARGRRFVVERQGALLRRRDYAGTDECLSGDDAACVRVLERSGTELPVAAIGHRIAFVQLAIQLGGPQAPARVLRADEAPAQRVASISGLPTDSLVRLWQSRVRNTRTPSDNMTPGMALSSLGWIGLLGALALRSRRWR